MSTEYKYSREACGVAKRLFRTTQYWLMLLETYSDSKHKLNISTKRLSYARNQLNQTRQTAAVMCMSKHPFINSTNTEEINEWGIGSTYTDQYGAVHYSTNIAVYIFVILLITAIFAVLLIWVCKGPMWGWVVRLFRGTATQQRDTGSQQDPQSALQHVISITQDGSDNFIGIMVYHIFFYELQSII